MSMPLATVFLDPAIAELRQAVAYYNEQEPGLGFEK